MLGHGELAFAVAVGKSNFWNTQVNVYISPKSSKARLTTSTRFFQTFFLPRHCLRRKQMSSLCYRQPRRQHGPSLSIIICTDSSEWIRGVLG